MRRVAVLFLILGSLNAQSEWNGVERVVAVGDVHGDYAAFVSVLRAAGIIDGKEKWIGGKAHLVQTGDVLDRGDTSRKAMDLLMSLEKQAVKAGGRVHALIGNHEAMNLYGDLRYATAGEFAAFKTGQSAEVRSAFWEQESKSLPSPPNDAARKTWETEHPLGWFEHRIEFSPKGKYGKWIRSHPAIIKINDSIYMHGGISPRFVEFSLDQINEMIARELNDFSRINNNSAVIADDGPLWYRGLSQDASAADPAHVDRVLAKYGVNHIVVGHTPTAGAILPRYGGKVIVIDVGLSAYYGSHPACLVQEGKTAYAMHRGTKVPLPDASDAGLARYVKRTLELEPPGSALSKQAAEVESPAALKK